MKLKIAVLLLAILLMPVASNADLLHTLRDINRGLQQLDAIQMRQQELEMRKQLIEIQRQELEYRQRLIDREKERESQIEWVSVQNGFYYDPNSVYVVVEGILSVTTRYQSTLQRWHVNCKTLACRLVEPYDTNWASTPADAPINTLRKTLCGE